MGEDVLSRSGLTVLDACLWLCQQPARTHSEEVRLLLLAPDAQTAQEEELKGPGEPKAATSTSLGATAGERTDRTICAVIQQRHFPCGAELPVVKTAQAISGCTDGNVPCPMHMWGPQWSIYRIERIQKRKKKP